MRFYVEVGMFVTANSRELAEFLALSHVTPDNQVSGVELVNIERTD